MASPTKRHLFDLPPELRNKIYRYALHEGSVFIEPSGWSRPGLLRTSKKLRDETLKIYYYENDFWITCEEFDCTPLRLFYTHLLSLSLKIDPRPSTTRGHHPLPTANSFFIFHASYRPINSEHWRNLKQMLQWVHCGLLPEDDEPPLLHWRAGGRGVLTHLITCLVALVEGMKGREWGEVERVVELHRPTLGAVDEGWMEGV